MWVSSNSRYYMYYTMGYLALNSYKTNIFISTTALFFIFKQYTLLYINVFFKCPKSNNKIQKNFSHIVKKNISSNFYYSTSTLLKETLCSSGVSVLAAAAAAVSCAVSACNWTTRPASRAWSSEGWGFCCCICSVCINCWS